MAGPIRSRQNGPDTEFLTERLPARLWRYQDVVVKLAFPERGMTPFLTGRFPGEGRASGVICLLVPGGAGLTTVAWLDQKPVRPIGVTDLSLAARCIAQAGARTQCSEGDGHNPTPGTSRLRHRSRHPQTHPHRIGDRHARDGTRSVRTACRCEGILAGAEAGAELCYWQSDLGHQRCWRVRQRAGRPPRRARRTGRRSPPSATAAHAPRAAQRARACSR